MSPGLAGLQVAGVLLLLSCDKPPPPYGFANGLEQAYVFEAEDRLVLGGEVVRVERRAEFRLLGRALEDGVEHFLAGRPVQPVFRRYNHGGGA